MIAIPLTSLVSNKLKNVEEDREEREKVFKKQIGEQSFKNIAHYIGEAVGMRKLFVHNYMERKQKGEMIKLRDTFGTTSRKLMKINVGESDIEEFGKYGIHNVGELTSNFFLKKFGKKNANGKEINIATSEILDGDDSLSENMI